MIRIGFIGIGNMGFAMAAGLLERGWPVAVRDIDAQREADAAQLGAFRSAGEERLLDGQPSLPQQEELLEVPAVLVAADVVGSPSDANAVGLRDPDAAGDSGD